MTRRTTYEELEERVKDLEAQLAVSRDMSDLKRAQEVMEQTNLELRKSEERFLTVADFTYDWEYWIDPDGNLIYLSPSCKRITGYGAEEYMKDPGLLQSIVHPEDRLMLAEHMKQEKALSEVMFAEFRMIARNKEERWIHHICQAVYGEDGRYLGRRASNRDITKRKHADAALQESEERYRQLAAKIPGVVYQLLREKEGSYGVPYMSQRSENILGLSLKDIQADISVLFDSFHPEDRERVLQEIEASARDLTPFTTESRVLLKDGKIRWIQASSLPRKTSQGQIIWDGVILDITDRKRSEEALLESDQNLRGTIDFLPDATFAVDTQGRVTSWNRAIEEMTGVKAEDIVGKGNYEYAIPFYQIRRPIMIDLVLRPDKETEKNIPPLKRKKTFWCSRPLTWWSTAGISRYGPRQAPCTTLKAM